MKPEPYWTSPDGTVVLYCGDCLQILPHLSGVDAVVTDPPYGIRADERQTDRADKQRGAAMAASKDYGVSAWDTSRPTKAAFDAMMSASRDQVIFGGNYFADLLPPSSSWIVWDKDNGDNGYADFELAWTSHDRAARKVRWRWHGMLQEHGGRWKESRVHPTQKPSGMMAWVLSEYTEPGSVVCDPYCGSGTTGVACVRTGRKFIGIEIEERYCAIAKRRIQEAFADQALFRQ